MSGGSRGRALEACQNFLSTAVSGGSRGRAGGGVGGVGTHGGGGGLGTHWRPARTSHPQQ